MSARIAPLALGDFDRLPKHARRCVFWELDPARYGGGDNIADPEFEKEAWMSMVMLTWGSCAQVATSIGAIGEEISAYALYAPPNTVPRATHFPTAPVSSDAVLLTTIGYRNAGVDVAVGHAVLAAVVADLVRRGVRALEAFGRIDHPDEKGPVDAGDAGRPVADCTLAACMLSADFLLDAGFVVVAPHSHFPRLRLELDKGLSWKADVEAALDRLLESVSVTLTAAAEPERVSVGCRTQS